VFQNNGLHNESRGEGGLGEIKNDREESEGGICSRNLFIFYKYLKKISRNFYRSKKISLEFLNN